MDHFPMPDVLECMKFVISAPGESRRITRNYEFDLYLGGEREIILDGVHYHISAGDLVYRKPGQSIIGYGDYNMYIITLDFSHTVDKTQKSFRSTATVQQPTCEIDVLEAIPPVFAPAHFSEMKLLYEKISRCFYTDTTDNSLQNLYVSELLFLILSDVYKHNRRLIKKDITRNSYIDDACKYINLNYEKQLSIEEIAQRLSINKNYLIKLFKQEMGTTPNQYIIEIRLLHAESFLAQTVHPIHDVAQLCGFNTTSYFIKCFKKAYGLSPLEYRKKAQK